MAKSFHAQLQNIQGLIEADMQKVLRQSAQDLGDIAQKPASKGGPMPVDKNFLRESFAGWLNGARVAKGEDAHILTIANLEPGDMLRLGWTAAYARRRNYEPVNGGMFRDVATAQWSDIVARNAAKVKRS